MMSVTKSSAPIGQQKVKELLIQINSLMHTKGMQFVERKKITKNTMRSSRNKGVPIAGLIKRITMTTITSTNVPKCPTCQSTQVEKITKGSKVGKALMWGVFALGSINKTFKCNNCGYKW